MHKDLDARTDTRAMEAVFCVTVRSTLFESTPLL